MGYAFNGSYVPGRKYQSVFLLGEENIRAFRIQAKQGEHRLPVVTEKWVWGNKSNGETYVTEKWVWGYKSNGETYKF